MWITVFLLSATFMTEQTDAVEEEMGHGSVTRLFTSPAATSALYSTITLNTGRPDEQSHAFSEVPTTTTTSKTYLSQVEVTPNMTSDLKSSLVRTGRMSAVLNTTSTREASRVSAKHTVWRNLRLSQGNVTGMVIRNVGSVSPTTPAAEPPIISINITGNRALTNGNNSFGINIMLPLWLLITVVIIALGLLVIVGALLLHGWLRKKKGNDFHCVTLSKNGFWSSHTHMYESQSKYNPISGATLERTYWDTPLSTFSTQRAEAAKKPRRAITTSFYGDTADHIDQVIDCRGLRGKGDIILDAETVSREEIERLLTNQMETSI